MSPQTFDIVSTLVTLLISICVIVIVIGIIAAIALAITAIFEKDKPKRKKLIYWMLVSLFGPILILIVVLSIWGLVSVVAHTFKG